MQGIKLTTDQAHILGDVCTERFGSIQEAAREIRDKYDQMDPPTGSRWFEHILPRYLNGLRVGVVPARAILVALGCDPRIGFLNAAASKVLYHERMRHVIDYQI